jgi:hypothetical protein
VRGQISCFDLPKGGSDVGEYEDAYYVDVVSSADGEIDGPEVRIALSDGASESLLAGRWAGELVRRFARIDAVRFAKTLKSATRDWERGVTDYVNERSARGVPVRWYEEPGLEQGAFATLLVLRLRDLEEDPRRGFWSAFALGDTCLFQVREETLVSAFPVTSSSDFGSAPALVPSRPRDIGRVASKLRACHGDWRAEDAFYLATDALSAWFLADNEAGRRPWETLRDLGTADAPLSFADWVRMLRSRGVMRNDDVTLVRLTTW